jgi:hypothetical protein
MADSKSSFQNLGNGTYRVGGARRSAITGRYVTNTAAAKHPHTSATDKTPSENSTSKY